MARQEQSPCPTVAA